MKISPQSSELIQLRGYKVLNVIVLSYRFLSMTSKEDTNITDEGNDENYGSLRKLISDKASNTGMHGLPNAQRAGSWVRMMFWLLLVLAGLSK